MSAAQEWTKTVNSLMSRLEGTMEVLGVPSDKPQDLKDMNGAEPEQKEHDLSRLPGHELADQAHASETLSNLRAQFQNVSSLLRDSHACSWVSHARLHRQPGPGGVAAGAMPLGS